MKTTLEEEINIWLMFWGGTALMFVILWCYTNLRDNTENKNSCKPNKNVNTDKK